jgi:2,3-bisphosphoglycerate-dependent phosphoglycerate mutase
MKSTTLLIACHGFNFEPGEEVLCVGAKSDAVLCKTGLKQGTVLGKHLKQAHLIPQKIFTSAQQSTIQMAQQVVKAIGQDIPIEPLPQFNDLDFGPYEGKPYDEMCEKIGEDGLKAWNEECLPPLGWVVDPTDLRAAWYDFGENVAKEFSGQTVLIITHNNTARFSSMLTGDRRGLHTDHGMKLLAGAYGQFVHTDPFWECLDWNVQPVPQKTTKKKAE